MYLYVIWQIWCRARSRLVKFCRLNISNFLLSWNLKFLVSTKKLFYLECFFSWKLLLNSVRVGSSSDSSWTSNNVVLSTEKNDLGKMILDKVRKNFTWIFMTSKQKAKIHKVTHNTKVNKKIIRCISICSDAVVNLQ